jgi:hypothetical protein
MLLTFVAYLFVVKLSRKFSTKKDYPQELPVVTAPVTNEEYLNAVDEHLDKKPVSNSSR